MEIIIKVNSTYNNTIISALYKGKILKTISTGSLGFKKAKRASTLAAQTCGEALGSWLLLLNKNVARNSLAKRELNLATSPRNVKNVGESTVFPKGLTQRVSNSSKVGLREKNDSQLMGEQKMNLSPQDSKTEVVRSRDFENVVKSEEIGRFSLKEKVEYSLLLDAKKKILSGKQNQQKTLSKKGSKNTKTNAASQSSNPVNNQQVNMLRKDPRENSNFEGKDNGSVTESKGIRSDSRNEANESMDVCNNVSLLIAGVGYGKFGVIRGLSKLGIKIKTISDVTSIPHNGCKPPKMRRK